MTAALLNVGTTEENQTMGNKEVTTGNFREKDKYISIKLLWYNVILSGYVLPKHNILMDEV